MKGMLVAMAVLAFFFWRTDARYKPGFLFGMAAIVYGLSRFTVEYFREPDVQRQWVVDATGLSMGQWLTVPMILIGVWLVATAKPTPKAAPTMPKAFARSSGAVTSAM